MTNQNSVSQRLSIAPQLNRLSLRGRLTLFVLVIALIPLVVLSFINIAQTQSALTKAAQNSLSTGAQQAATNLDTFITNTLDNVRVEAQIQDFIDYLSLFPTKRAGSSEEQHAKDLLQKLKLKDTDNIISYGLIDLSGNVLLDSDDSRVGKNESVDEYFLGIISSKLPIATSVTYSNGSNTVIHFASLVKDPSGKTLGILRAEYDASILQQIIVKSAGLSTTAQITLIDDYGIRIADNRQPQLIQKSIVPLPVEKFLPAVNGGRLKPTSAGEQSTNLVDFDQKLQNAQNQPFFTSDLDPGESGDDSVAVAFMSSRPWIVAYSQPTSVFLSDVQNQTLFNIFLTVGAALIIILLAALVARSLSLPILHLTDTANIIAQGDLNTRAEVETDDEIGSLAKTFNLMAEQLQTNVAGLEKRVEDRTLTLERRSAELAIVAEVARDINTIRNVDTLLNLTANLIRDRFNAYHVAIYLVDDRGEFVNLRAASGSTGQTMIDNHYKLRLNGPGIIAFVARTGESHLAEDVEKDPTFIKNPLLPDTRSETSLPLRAGNSIIGVLDIQSKEASAFSPENAQTMQLLADQIVGALDNAQLLTQLETTLQELNKARQAQTELSWQKAIRDRTQNALEYDGSQTRVVDEPVKPDVLMRLQNRRAVVLNDINGLSTRKNTLLVPLVVSDKVVGVIGLEQDDPNYEWTNEEINLAQTAAARAALSLENARLLEESQKRASKERSISNAANRIGSMQQIENILFATAEELEKALGGSEIVIQFKNEE